jgi:hypothetical protein
MPFPEKRAVSGHGVTRSEHIILACCIVGPRAGCSFHDLVELFGHALVIGFALIIATTDNAEHLNFGIQFFGIFLMFLKWF